MWICAVFCWEQPEALRQRRLTTSSVSQAVAVFGAEIGLEAETGVAIELAVEIVIEVEAKVDWNFVSESELIREEPGTKGRRVKAGILIFASQ